MNVEPDAVASDVTKAKIYYNPFDFDHDDGPYPVWNRLRAEVPPYRNDKLGF